jgi:hypothetical protein
MRIDCGKCKKFIACRRHDIIFEGLKQIVQSLAKTNTVIIGSLPIIECPDFEV